MDSSVKHEFRHDLESILSILIYLCIRFSGPNGKVAPGGLKALPDFIRDWFMSTSPLSVGSAKWGMISMPSRLFFDQYLNRFQPYFEPLKPCVNKLQKMFTQRRGVSHEKMMEIFWETLVKLQEPQTPPSEPVSKGVKRCADDTRNPSDSLQSKYAKQAVTVGGKEIYTRQCHLREAYSENSKVTN